jgi:soluble lytic murein transglycosylase-like protein
MMQVTSVSAKVVGLTDLTYLLADPVNIQAGTHYLRKMMQ